MTGIRNLFLYKPFPGRYFGHSRRLVLYVLPGGKYTRPEVLRYVYIHDQLNLIYDHGLQGEQWQNTI